MQTDMLFKIRMRLLILGEKYALRMTIIAGIENKVTPFNLPADERVQASGRGDP